MSATVATVSELLLREHGMLLDTPGRGRLERALADMARERGVDVARLVVAPRSPELREVADRVTLQETGFFRDPRLWSGLAQSVLPGLVSAAHGRLECWSAGAARGEEAYSLAIALHEAGCTDFRVVASELHRGAAARIASGRYAERELRGLSAERREAWLRRGSDGVWTVREELRGRVEPVVHNIVTQAPPLTPSSCSLVLCRYVLIYLSPEACRRFLRRVEGLLRPEGVLAVGAAESLWHITDRFAVENLPSAFVYRPRPVAPSARPVPRDDAPAAPGPAPPTVGAPPPSPAAAPPPSPAAAAPASGAAAPPPASSPARAPRALPGSAAPAPSPPDPVRHRDAVALLAAGEAALHRGDLGAAAESFRGAAYLEPASPLAHLQLGLVLEQQGDAGALRAFRAAWDALSRSDPTTLGPALGNYRAEELVHLVAAKIEAAS